MRATEPAEVRAVIASHVLGANASHRNVGSITLHQHQRDAARRIREIMRAHGGALLADEVGLGKTYVALAVAVEFSKTVVVAPAALRAMWRSASERARVPVRFVSMELLGRGGSVPSTEIVIVDEAHHFRNRNTKRYAHLAEGCARSSVLLLSATPVQNEIDDLRHLLALIVGQRALSLDLASLSRLIVRRAAATASAVARLPDVLPPQSIALDRDEDCLDELCSLPPPVPPSDGGHAHALLTLSLARQWASSRSALLAALTRRLAMARAMDDALSSRRHLTRAELAMWQFSDGAQQLAFPQLAGECAELDARLLDQVRAHADAVRGLIARLRVQPDIDALRAEQLRLIASRHPGERIVAFAEFTETVAILYRLLAPTHRVAMVTNGGGRVAGGPLARGEVLAQFGPAASPAEHARIDLLLATDVLSEGVDLQGASVLVHLDLTWNPARMEQRVGRLRRLGASRHVITVYVFSPPAPAERLLQMDRRLREKLGDAARSVGLAGAILPGIAPASDSVVSQRERSLEVLRSWLAPIPIHDSVVWAAVQWEEPGAIACVRCGGETVVVAMLGSRIEVDPPAELLHDVAARPQVECLPPVAESVRDQLEQWLQRRSLSRTIDATANDVARSRRTILNRLNGITSRTRRHERSSLNAMFAAARQACTATMPAGAERVLHELAHARLPDEAWLRAIGEFSSIHGRTAPEPDAVLGMLVLQPAER